MDARQLLIRSLTYYWRTNVAVIAGVATAVAVLAGALLVGDSVRGSLRDLIVQRLGRTDYVLISTGFFREQLGDVLNAADDFRARFRGAIPLVMIRGAVSEQASGRRAGQVRVYGIDDRFWQFHGVENSQPAEDEAVLSPALARELGAQPDATILLRVERPSDIPLESLHGRKEDLGRTLRFAVRGIASASAMGEFSLEPHQGEVRALFVPLRQLQEALDIPERVNAVLVASLESQPGSAAMLEDLVRREATLADLGLRVEVLPDLGVVAIGSDAGLLADPHAAAAVQVAGDSARDSRPLFTYLANTLRIGDREVPYSLVTALDLPTVAPTLAPAAAEPAIVLNEWAASDLRARPGDLLTLEYYLWEDPGRLVTRSADFRVAAIVPVSAGDRQMAPAFPGITDSPTLVDWDPPFPLDLRRIGARDEAYWNAYRTTPKAFVSLETGQRLWRSRHGALTSVRLVPPPGESLDAARGRYEARLRERIDPLQQTLAVRDVRAASLAASRGATDFGAYFVYFSFFIVVSALLLAALFFKLGLEQRGRELGLLRAVGFAPPHLRGLFLREGFMLAIAGSVLGMAGAIGYGALVMWALRTWWIDAVGTQALALHISMTSLALGAAAAIAAAMICIWWTLRGLGRVSERELLTGHIETTPIAGQRGPRYVLGALVLAVVALTLLIASSTRFVDPAGGFFGAGALLLVSALSLFAAILRQPAAGRVWSRGWRSVSQLGLRNTTYRPGRSVLAIAVIASATFILVAVDAFRRDSGADAGGRQSGVGGYSLFVETVLPIAHDPNTFEGRQAISLGHLEGISMAPFRLLPGDDTSCLNLYTPTQPRILAPADAFLDEGRFTFQSSLASTDAERVNPWLLLNREATDGTVPVISDANSMTYVLHRAVGDEFVMSHRGRQIRLRIVGALRDSIFQSELLMGQRHFIELFPEQQGYQVLMVDAPEADAVTLAADLEGSLTDYGADATAAGERLAAFHRVENTYLSTFQTLGGLGLLLGTVGLATVMLRNALERRRELALLGAVGFGRQHFIAMAVAENAVLLGAGLLAGVVCAGIAIAPAVAERGGRLPLSAGGLLLIFAVFVTGLLSSLAATRVVTRAPLLESLRAE
jgi:ABC-type lipoprotein release transport system permease subunit